MNEANNRLQACLPPSLVIFDFDGTLADSFGFFRSLLPELAGKFGFRLPTPEEQEMMRAQPPRQIMQALGIPAWKLPIIAMHTRGRARAAGVFPLFPGAAGLIETLTGQGIPVAIVSSNAQVVIARALGPQVSSRISAWSCGAAMFGKARHFRRVIRRTRADPGRVIGVGDETRDIEAARQVGIAALAVSWGFAPEPVLAAAGPDQLFGTIEELEAFLLKGKAGTP